jgi:hypothetical protein
MADYAKSANPKPARMSVVGTFRTQRDVWLESVMRVKADIGEMNIAACSSR